jgi:hypothetical protein
VKICDYCSGVVEQLVEETLHLSVKDGIWTSKSIELCLPCQKSLHIMEREAREYAIIKSHSDFLDGMREDEAARKRNSLNYFMKTTQTTLKTDTF